MSKRQQSEESSLELLLDTMCNTFGGVMFIAISLLVIISVMTKDIPQKNEEPTDMETLQQETVEEETASLEPAQDAVEAGEEPVVEAEQVVEGEPTVEAICGSDTDLEIDEPSSKEIPDDLKNDIKSVLVYMDQLLDSLPEEKIAEFARSEHFELYKKLFTELGLS